jgi:uroporphyrinogen decarboxylase
VLADLRRACGSVPTIVFTKGGGQWLEQIAASGCDGVGIDWTTHIGAARARIGARVAVQGNLDPQVLLAGREAIEREARAVLLAAGPQPGHIFNLGHGVLPQTPPEHIAALIAFVHAESRALRHPGGPAR